MPSKQFCPKGHDTWIVGRTNYKCRECHRQAMRKENMKPDRRARATASRMSPKGKLKARDYALRKRSDWSQAKYESAYAQQGGCCAICGEYQDKLVCDHDHATGKARALLCWKHNIGLGYFADKPELMRQAADYLAKWAEPSFDAP